MQKEIAYNESNYDEVESFELILGYIPGYNQEELGSQHKYDDVEKFNELYYQIAEKIYKEDKIFITAVISKSRVIYPGCIKGEKVYSIRGGRNSEFAENKEEYRKAVHKVASILADILQQTTYSITWNNNVSYTYFKKE